MDTLSSFVVIQAKIDLDFSNLNLSKIDLSSLGISFLLIETKYSLYLFLLFDYSPHLEY